LKQKSKEKKQTFSTKYLEDEVRIVRLTVEKSCVFKLLRRTVDKGKGREKSWERGCQLENRPRTPSPPEENSHPEGRVCSWYLSGGSASKGPTMGL